MKTSGGASVALTATSLEYALVNHEYITGLVANHLYVHREDNLVAHRLCEEVNHSHIGDSRHVTLVHVIDYDMRDPMDWYIRAEYK